MPLLFLLLRVLCVLRGYFFLIVNEMASDKRLRYSRHVALAEFGEDGQARIGRSRALVVGLGGLGSPAAIYLASSGVGHLFLNDFDSVDLSNLQRQPLFRSEDIGRLKATAAIDMLRNMNPDVQYHAIDRRLHGEELHTAVRNADVVLDSSDNFGTRFAINEACVVAGVPLVSGAAIRFEGQVSVFGSAGDSPCYRCLYGESDEELENCQGQGILAPVVGVIGCMMAVEALKILTGIGDPLSGRLMLYDGLKSEWRMVSLRKDPHCPTCGSELKTED